MKNILLLLLQFTTASIGSAQGVFNNQTNTALEQVIKNYPSQFKNIKGAVLPSDADAYQSTVVIPGALSNTITFVHAENKQNARWQSVVYAGARFASAKTRFSELFNQIKNTIVKPEGEKAAIINGLYMNPSEDKTFTTIQFDLMPATGYMQKLNIDLMLLNTGSQWKIILSVYDKALKETEIANAK